MNENDRGSWSVCASASVIWCHHDCLNDVEKCASVFSNGYGDRCAMLGIHGFASDENVIDCEIEIQIAIVYGARDYGCGFAI